jgi:hypothetical protein
MEASQAYEQSVDHRLREIRRLLGVRPGDRLLFESDGVFVSALSVEGIRQVPPPRFRVASAT